MKDRAEQFFNEGLDFAKLGRFTEALDSYDKAVAIKMDYAIAWPERGNFLIKLHKYSEVIDSYDKVVALNLDFANPWYARGIALSNLSLHIDSQYIHGNASNHLGRHTEAIESYDQALAINQDYTEAKELRNIALGREKKKS